MPSRSLQHLPPRSLARSQERSAPCRARRLAGRAGSGQGHPLLKMHDNKAGNIPLKPRCLPAAGDSRTEIRAAASPPTLRGFEGGSDAVRRQIIQIAAGLAHTLELPRFPGLARLAAPVMCLQPADPARGAGTAVVQEPCATSSAQNWAPINVGTNSYQFINQASGLCMDVRGRALAGTPIEQCRPQRHDDHPPQAACIAILEAMTQSRIRRRHRPARCGVVSRTPTADCAPQPHDAGLAPPDRTRLPRFQVKNFSV